MAVGAHARRGLGTDDATLMIKGSVVSTGQGGRSQGLRSTML